MMTRSINKLTQLEINKKPFRQIDQSYFKPVLDKQVPYTSLDLIQELPPRPLKVTHQVKRVESDKFAMPLAPLQVFRMPTPSDS
jgi:hypothetical protein